MKNKPIHILIVDDHAIVRRGLKDILAEAYPDAVFVEAGDSSTGLQEFHRGKWDVVLLDINIPGRGGLDLLEDIRRTDPKGHVLVVSAFPEAEFAVRAFRLGAAGYLTKSQAPEELVEAVKTVLAGEKYITAALARRFADTLSGDGEAAPHELLSARELQVLRLVADGRSAKQIAAELALSERTVETYRARIAEKTGLAGNVELTRYAFQHGLTQ